VGTVRATTRTVPFAFVSMQAGLGLPALTLIVPVGGLETKTKHVLLQPVSEIPDKGENSSNVQTYLHRARLFFISCSAIRHLRTSRNSREVYILAPKI
jgi:hypothetical protein